MALRCSSTAHLFQETCQLGLLLRIEPDKPFSLSPGHYGFGTGEPFPTCLGQVWTMPMEILRVDYAGNKAEGLKVR